MSPAPPARPASLVVAALGAALLAAPGCARRPAPAAAAPPARLLSAPPAALQDEPGEITLLHTSDLHSNIAPYDYVLGEPDARRGLAKIATLVRAERARRPCSLLLDSGDTLQGSPLGAYAARHPSLTPPMAQAMRMTGYDAAVVGNHDFDEGLPVLGRFVAAAGFPVLGANVSEPGGRSPFAPSFIREVCGVRVGLIGLVTPVVPAWQAPGVLEGLRFDDVAQTASTEVRRLRAEGAELIVVLLHSGPDRQPPGGAEGADWRGDPGGWRPVAGMLDENQALSLAERVAGIDVILSGHTHLAIPEILRGTTLITQPGRYGSHLGEVTLGLGRDPSGRRGVVRRGASLLTVEGAAPDGEVLEATRQAHEATLAYVARPLGSAVAPFPGGPAARLLVGPLAGLVNEAQMQAARDAGVEVDASATAVFTASGKLPAGAITLQDVFGVYPFENTLQVLELSGQTLRRALEKDAAYFAQLDTKRLPASLAAVKADPQGPEYNWDLYSGIEYTLDLTRPAGDRVARLSLRGRAVGPEQIVRLALSSYRAGGGGGYDMFRGAKVTYRSVVGVRELLTAYVSSRSPLDPARFRSCAMTLLPDLYSAYAATRESPSPCRGAR